MERRTFLWLLGVGTAGLASCVYLKKNKEGLIPTEQVEFEGMRIANYWDYPIKFRDETFYKVAEKFGLPLPETRPVEIVITSEDYLYRTQEEDQYHLVTLLNDKPFDRIRISAGRYVNIIQSLKERKPSTPIDEQFMSVALSESMFNGLSDLAVARGEIPVEIGNQLVGSYAQSLVRGENIKDLVFTLVLIPELHPDGENT